MKQEKRRQAWWVGVLIVAAGCMAVGETTCHALSSPPPMPPPLTPLKIARIDLPPDRKLQAELLATVQEELKSSDYDKIFAHIKALHDQGAIAEGDAEELRPIVQGHEQALARLPDLPTYNPLTPGLSEVKYDARAFLNKYGMSVAAYAVYAQCVFREHDYEDALYGYRIAQLWQPKNAKIQQGLAQVEEALRVVKGIDRQLPKYNHIFAVCPYSEEKGHKVWAVIQRDYGSPPAAALYDETEGKFTLLCRADTFRNDRMTLYVVRATGRPSPEIVIIGGSGNIDAPTSDINIYEVQSGKLHSLLSTVSIAYPTLTDWRHDGRYQVRIDRTRYGMVWRAGIPSPPHYFAFNGTEYVLADRDYPEGFTEYIPRAQEALKKYHNDFGLLYGIGYVYDIQKNKSKAEEYYRKAEAACRAVIRKEGASADDPFGGNSYKKALKQILAREPQPNF